MIPIYYGKKKCLIVQVRAQIINQKVGVSVHHTAVSLHFISSHFKHIG